MDPQMMMPTEPPPMGQGAMSAGSALMPMSPPSMGGIDDELFSILNDVEPAIPPKYRHWFKPPPKPSADFVMSHKDKLATDYLDRNLSISQSLAALRWEVSGVFPEDRRDYDLGLKNGWISTEIRDTWNAAWSTIASNTVIYNRKIYDPDLAMKSQLMEDAAYDMRDRERRAWAFRGDMPLEIAEAKILTAYGVLAKRIVVDMLDPDFPFDIALVDPAQLYPIWEGKRGLKSVTRCYRSTLYDVVFDYLNEDELTPEIKKRLTKDNGEYDDCSDTLHEVIEYWDRWWNMVILEDGTVIKKATAHKYGVVPYVITFGPGGEPQYTQPQDYYYRRNANGDVTPIDRVSRSSAYKSTSIVQEMLVRNMQTEQVQNILVEELKKANQPPIILERSTMASKNKSRIVVDGRARGVTETLLNEERASPFPTAPNPGLIQTIMQFIGKDGSTNGLNLSLLNQIQSNVSGTAVNAAADSGQYQLFGWNESMATHYRSTFELSMEIWRNKGHLSRFMSEKPKEFKIASRGYQHRPVCELTPELLDEMGYEIDVRLHHMRNGEMVPLANALTLLNEKGFMSKRTATSQYLGITDWDREYEEWRNERSIDLAFQEPDFLKIFTIPMAVQKEIARLEGNPGAQVLMQMMYEEWKQKISMPTEMMMQQAGQPPQPPGMGNPMGAQPPGGPPNMGPNASQGMSFPDMGLGPGSQSGQMGGPPPGPQGPQGPPPIPGM